MAVALTVPAAFKRSYENSEMYPHNLIYQTSYPTVISTYKARLDNYAPRIFVEDASEIEVSFRDFWSSRQPPATQYVRSDAALKAWIGDASTVDPLDQSLVGPLVTKRDPRCRFIFIWAENSRKPLKITKNMLTRILSYHQVITGYLDFILVFGLQSEPRDLRFSGFREHAWLRDPPGVDAITSLGRSGRQYQMCYNLKSVSCKTGQTTDIEDQKWVIRQAAFHHQFDAVEGTTLWIVTEGRHEIMDRVKQLTGKDGKPEDRACDTKEESFRSTLAVHLMYANWSAGEWRWYIQWLEQVIDRQTNIAIYGPRGPGEFQKDYTPSDLQSVQDLADRTNEAIMILEANTHILTSLQKFYEQLLDNADFPLKVTCREDVLTFATRIKDMIYDLNLQIARAKLLIQITNDRRNLVIQQFQSQATDKMEALTVSMWYMGALAQKEAIAMRIITWATLIFLPATFVSTFFSTDIIKYQDQNSFGQNNWGQSFSIVALIRWIEVTLPLTLLVVGLAIIFFRISDKRRRLALETLPMYIKGS